MPGLPYFLPALLPGPLDAYAPDTSGAGGADGTLTSVTSYCDAARALIISQYAESPRVLAWLCSFVDRVQQIDNALAAVYQHGLSVDTAEGVQLAALGRIVGEDREGRLDDDFRRGVRTRVLVNRSQGRTADLAAIAYLFASVADESGAYVRVSTHVPGTVTVRTVRTPVASPTDMVKRLRRATAAGVRLNSVTLASAPADALRLVRAVDAAAGASPIGLASTGGSPGGALAIGLQ